MRDDEVVRLIAAERRRTADLLAGLTEEQWQAGSLCSEWTVRDVAAHLIGPFCVSVPRFMAGAVKAGGFHRYSVRASRELARRPTAEIVATLRDHADSAFAPLGTGIRAPLTDVAVHTRDIARPLGLDTTATGQAWAEVLGFLTSRRAAFGFVPRGRLRDLRIVAYRPAVVGRDGGGGVGPRRGAGARHRGPGGRAR